MIIIGIDPGYRVTGYGIIKVTDGKINYISSGRITLIKLTDTTKLVFLAESIIALIAMYQPSEGACEQVFFAKNHQSTIKLGKVLGIAHCLLGQNMPVFEYATTSVKKILCGKGNALKSEVREEIRTLLKIDQDLKLSEDECDALAVAVCHSHLKKLAGLEVLLTSKSTPILLKKLNKK